jgi:hypothetical protein
MRLPRSAHTERPWRIHELAPDFSLEDVWALPTPGGPDDLTFLVEQFSDGDGPETAGPIVHLLFAVRWKLGALLHWDTQEAGLSARAPSLRDRLPDDLRNGERGPNLRSLPFTSVYQTRNEWVAESANRTVHAVMHMGWVQASDGSYHAQMAVLVKPNGLMGRIYMAAIAGFRYTAVYPALLRSIGREWAARRPAG